MTQAMTQKSLLFTYAACTEVRKNALRGPDQKHFPLSYLNCPRARHTHKHEAKSNHFWKKSTSVIWRLSGSIPRIWSHGVAQVPEIWQQRTAAIWGAHFQLASLEHCSRGWCHHDFMTLRLFVCANDCLMECAWSCWAGEWAVTGGVHDQPRIWIVPWVKTKRAIRSVKGSNQLWFNS